MHGRALVRRSPHWRLPRREAVGECGMSGSRGSLDGSAESWFGAPVGECQVVLAIQWLWSFSRLWVAVTSRHSDRAAALPLRINLSVCRLYLIWPNTGSIVIFRCA